MRQTGGSRIPAIPVLMSLFLALAAVVSAGPALSAGPVAGPVAYALVKAAAMRWQPDAEMFDFATMPSAPLDAEGRSAEWISKWSSKKAGKVNLMTVKNGTLITFEVPTAGGASSSSGRSRSSTRGSSSRWPTPAGAPPSGQKGATVTAGLVQNLSAGRSGT